MPFTSLERSSISQRFGTVCLIQLTPRPAAVLSGAARSPVCTVWLPGVQHSASNEPTDPAAGGTLATASLWVHDNEPCGRVRLGITFFGADGAKIGNTDYGDYTEDQADWQELSHSATAPEGAASAQILVRFYDVKKCAADGEEWTTATVAIDQLMFTTE